jgi:hypothetical protein
MHLTPVKFSLLLALLLLGPATYGQEVRWSQTFPISISPTDMSHESAGDGAGGTAWVFSGIGRDEVVWLGANGAVLYTGSIVSTNESEYHNVRIVRLTKSELAFQVQTYTFDDLGLAVVRSNVLLRAKKGRQTVVTERSLDLDEELPPWRSNAASLAGFFSCKNDGQQITIRRYSN